MIYRLVRRCIQCYQEFPVTEKSKRRRCLKCQPPKYRAHGFWLRGVWWPSQREWKRWLVLSEDEKEGKIRALIRQVHYPIYIEGIHICDYVADFQYYRDGKLVVEDAKGMKTPEYKLKKKMVEAVYKLKIKET